MFGRHDKTILSFVEITRSKVTSAKWNSIDFPIDCVKFFVNGQEVITQQGIIELSENLGLGLEIPEPAERLRPVVVKLTKLHLSELNEFQREEIRQNIKKSFKNCKSKSLSDLSSDDIQLSEGCVEARIKVSPNLADEIVEGVNNKGLLASLGPAIAWIELDAPEYPSAEGFREDYDSCETLIDKFRIQSAYWRSIIESGGRVVFKNELEVSSLDFGAIVLEAILDDDELLGKYKELTLIQFNPVATEKRWEYSSNELIFRPGETESAGDSFAKEIAAAFVVLPSSTQPQFLRTQPSIVDYKPLVVEIDNKGSTHSLCACAWGKVQKSMRLINVEKILARLENLIELKNKRRNKSLESVGHDPTDAISALRRVANTRGDKYLLRYAYDKLVALICYLFFDGECLRWSHFMAGDHARILHAIAPSAYASKVIKIVAFEDGTYTISINDIVRINGTTSLNGAFDGMKTLFCTLSVNQKAEFWYDGQITTPRSINNNSAFVRNHTITMIGDIDWHKIKGERLCLLNLKPSFKTIEVAWNLRVIDRRGIVDRFGNIHFGESISDDVCLDFLARFF
jgi:hypothetical protein